MKFIYKILSLCISIFSLSSVLVALDGNYIYQLESATQAQINTITTPQKGTMIYNSTTNQINYYDGTSWLVLLAKNLYNSNSKLTQQREVNLSTFSLSFVNGGVGVGDTTPDASLDVAGSIRIDGTFSDKDGDVGMPSQVLTATSVGTDWSSVLRAPYISSNTIVVAASTTQTITIKGNDFIPTSAVTIPGFNGSINSTNIVSPNSIELSITTGATGTFDVLISNNGILNTQWTNNGVGLLQVN
jgi:hypothetical protein